MNRWSCSEVHITNLQAICYVGNNHMIRGGGREQFSNSQSFSETQCVTWCRCDHLLRWGEMDGNWRGLLVNWLFPLTKDKLLEMWCSLFVTFTHFYTSCLSCYQLRLKCNQTVLCCKYLTWQECTKHIAVLIITGFMKSNVFVLQSNTLFLATSKVELLIVVFELNPLYNYVLIVVLSLWIKSEL